MVRHGSSDPIPSALSEDDLRPPSLRARGPVRSSTEHSHDVLVPSCLHHSQSTLRRPGGLPPARWTRPIAHRLIHLLIRIVPPSGGAARARSATATLRRAVDSASSAPRSPHATPTAPVGSLRLTKLRMADDLPARWPAWPSCPGPPDVFRCVLSLMRDMRRCVVADAVSAVLFGATLEALSPMVMSSGDWARSACAAASSSPRGASDSVSTHLASLRPPVQ